MCFNNDIKIFLFIIVIHFRHLMGEQAIRVTNEIAQQLMDPVCIKKIIIVQIPTFCKNLNC